MAKTTNLELLQAEAPAGVTVRQCFRAEPPVHRQLGRVFFGALGALLIASLRGGARYHLVGVADDAVLVLPMPRRAGAAGVTVLRGADLRRITIKSGVFRTKIAIDTPEGRLQLRVPGMAAHSTSRAGLEALKQLCAAQPA